MIFEPIIGFQEARKNISSRKERIKVAEMRTGSQGREWPGLAVHGSVRGREARKTGRGGSKCHTQEHRRSFNLERSEAGGLH